MEYTNKISYYFRKYALLRVACLLFIIIIGFTTYFLVKNRTKPAPVITKIEPPVGAPGDIIVIYGENFGDSREEDMNYVEFSGVKLTSSSYMSWSNNQIKIILPANIQDGLVVVGSKTMKSNPSFFANNEGIPILVPEVLQLSTPVITGLSSENVSVGQLLTIEGSNFGDVRNQSKVLFTIDYGNKIKNTEYVTSTMIQENMVEVNENEYGYDYWTNNEIRVRVPDGAATGAVIVSVGKENSEPYNINISNAAGTKELINKKQYLIQYEVNVKDVISDDNGTFSIRCPIPVKYTSQPNVQATEISPSPALKNYQKCNVQQLSANKNNVMKENYTQTFIIDTYEVRTTVKPEKTGSLKENNKELFNILAYPDEIIPADDEKLVALVAEIVGKEKLQYKKAKLIYDYMCKNYEVLSKPRKDDSDPFDLISKKKGDAYDYAIIYAALCRTAGIAVNVNAGILVNQTLKTQPHWWCEMYLQNVGWIPVDVALGDEMEWKKWNDIPSSNEYYFGNLDPYHICFSRGLNQLKPFAQENSVVRYYRSFALQSVWEEASSTISKFNVYWNTPIVKGIY